MPKGYIIAELTVTDPGAEFQEYRDNVVATVEAFGGKFIVLGEETALLEGEAPQGRAIVLEFDSPERAMEWYNSPAYQKILPLRLRNATTRVLCASGG